MSKRFVDIIVIIPLEEELKQFCNIFKTIEDCSTTNMWRHIVDSGVPDISILAVQQIGMGRQHATIASSAALSDFDCNLLVCLGIAGGLSGDVGLCDVCYSGLISDILDNAKSTEPKKGKETVELTPTHYETPIDLSQAFNFIRTQPELSEQYLGWQAARGAEARRLLPGPIKGREGKSEVVGNPKTRPGTIVCGNVSASPAYNKRLKATDRKIIAIETESGGVFSVAKVHEVSAIAIRGISDHADLEKGHLEDQTSGAVRELAAANAATFFRLQLSNRYVVEFLARKRRKKGAFESDPLADSGASASTRTIADTLRAIGGVVDKKLSQLCQEFKLRQDGYYLPTPRVRKLSDGGPTDGRESTGPQEIRDALASSKVTVITIGRNYPDRSVPWVIASDLLSAEIDGKQAIPIVVDGSAIKPPSGTFDRVALSPFVASDEFEGVSIVFIVDNFDHTSKTRMEFLEQNIESTKYARTIVVTRGEYGLISGVDYYRTVAADIFEIDSVSFLEIANFLEASFGISGIESEVVALKLHQTFKKFNLTAYPTYFAGIPRDMLLKLLTANQRAELIELATLGFLSYVVAEDTSNVVVSRTTRMRFLKRLASECNVEKREFSHAQVVGFAKEFNDLYDLGIDPISFVNGFVERGILYFSDDRIMFALPFIETYLLAMELKEKPELARGHFSFDEDMFDLQTFDIYAEVGASEEIVDRLIEGVDEAYERHRLRDDEEHILLTNSVHPVFLSNPGRIDKLRDRLRKTEEEVSRNVGNVPEKQRLLDLADRVKEESTQETSRVRDDEPDSDAPGVSPQLADSPTRAKMFWCLSTILIGMGAENLTRERKDQLIRGVVRLSSIITHRGTTELAQVDYADMKARLLADEAVVEILEKAGDKQAELKNSLFGLVDLVEFSTLCDPFRRTVQMVCELAHARALGNGLTSSAFTSLMEQLFRALWLTDVDHMRGASELSAVIKRLPRAEFLRVNLAMHLLSRVYWSHYDTSARKKMLELALEAIKPLGFTFPRATILKSIDDDDKKAKEEKEKEKEKEKELANSGRSAK